MFRLICVLFIIGFLACSDSDENTKVDCTGIAPTYNTGVSAILNASCATVGCHDNISKTSGYDYSNYTAAKNSAASDKFLKSIKHQSGAEKMPSGGSKLPDATIKILECWVQNGRPE